MICCVVLEKSLTSQVALATMIVLRWMWKLLFITCLELIWWCFYRNIPLGAWISLESILLKFWMYCYHVCYFDVVSMEGTILSYFKGYWEILQSIEVFIDSYLVWVVSGFGVIHVVIPFLRFNILLGFLFGSL